MKKVSERGYLWSIKLKKIIKKKRKKWKKERKKKGEQEKLRNKYEEREKKNLNKWKNSVHWLKTNDPVFFLSFFLEKIKLYIEAATLPETQSN